MGSRYLHEMCELNAYSMRIVDNAAYVTGQIHMYYTCVCVCVRACVCVCACVCVRIEQYKHVECTNLAVVLVL